MGSILTTAHPHPAGGASIKTMQRSGALVERIEIVTDLKTYLRRTDVEGMLTMKIEALDERIARLDAEFQALPKEQRLTPNHPIALPMARKIADLEARKSALGAALGAVKFCEQFTLHDGHESNEAGIAELRDAQGNNVEPDGRRWSNEG